MDIREMKYFFEVCKYESILKASKSLHISQQALSKCMKKIECELGISLFYRDTNSIQLTNNGKYLYKKVKIQLHHHQLFIKEINDKFNDNTIIKLGIAPGVLRSLGSDILIKFKEINKNVQLEVIEKHDKVCEHMIRENQLDIAISTKPLACDDIDYYSIKSEELLVISHKNHKLDNCKNLQFKDLIHLPLVLCDNNFNLSSNIQNAFKQRYLIPNIVLVANEIEIAIDLVAKGKAINICAKHVVKSINNDNIVVSKLKNFNVNWEIGVIINKNTIKSKNIISLLETLKSTSI